MMALNCSKEINGKLNYYLFLFRKFIDCNTHFYFVHLKIK